MIRFLLAFAVIAALVILITTQILIHNPAEIAPGFYLRGPTA